ncbi:methyltransferase domain-containing protein [Patescibacteria group bacterium]|nr:MAG: methyltransferase domain-containing protein [Patescibacteria group bacterium]
MPRLQPESRAAQTSEQNKYWFVLGREPELSASELDAVLCLNGQFSINQNILIANAAVNGELINRLGGTIKIGREIGSGLSEEQMMEKIIDELKTIGGKIHFGLSFYGPPRLPMKTWGLRIKKELTSSGLSARYVENKTPVLSSVTVAKNNLLKRGAEFLIFGAGGKFSLAKTIAVQPFEEFSRRDYGRPARDDVSGMLPPKLAMMMINLTGISLPLLRGGLGRGKILLDPFCGSGTILTEALLLGYGDLVGSDVSAKAVADTLKNIEWTAKNKKINVFQSDSADIGKHLAPNSIDAIVTEPFLGKPLRGNESRADLAGQAEELRLLYEKAFQQFQKIIKPGGVVVFASPRFFFKNETVRVNFETKKYGFTPVPFFNKQNFLLYHRPGQRVAREIWRFVKR